MNNLAMTSALLYDILRIERREIRTLTVQPSKGQQHIRCVLTTASLDDCPAYTALSYVWGDAQDRVSIYVNGTEFSATRNLALALRYIQKPDEDVVLWVDAVCINQGDIDERNSQVQLMGTLYTEARFVLIWLGEADPTTDELVSAVEDKDTPVAPLPDAEDFITAHSDYALQVHRRMILFDIIALRSWWQRVWTVQECVLPRSDPTFQCGARYFTWRKFFDVFHDTFRKAQTGLNSM